MPAWSWRGKTAANLLYYASCRSPVWKHGHSPRPLSHSVTHVAYPFVTDLSLCPVNHWPQLFSHVWSFPLSAFQPLAPLALSTHAQTYKHTSTVSTLRLLSISCRTHTHLQACTFSSSLSSSHTADADMLAFRLVHHSVTHTRPWWADKRSRVEKKYLRSRVHQAREKGSEQGREARNTGAVKVWRGFQGIDVNC